MTLSSTSVSPTIVGRGFTESIPAEVQAYLNRIRIHDRITPDGIHHVQLVDSQSTASLAFDYQGKSSCIDQICYHFPDSHAKSALIRTFVTYLRRHHIQPREWQDALSSLLI